MNALTKTDTPSRNEIIRVLQNSLYPGAKAESIELALSYCRVNGIDPMLKAVHIVGMSVKAGKHPNGEDKYEWRDVLMPGIADYRIKAARSREYAGKDEPVFGPDVTRELGGVRVTFPLWCKVTIYRLVGAQVRPFTAKEYWLENYATVSRKSDAPNSMWRKRPYGQIAKCTEAQALRMAFPEFSGGAPTAEEMEGKAIEGFSGPTIEGEAERPSLPQVRRPATITTAEAIGDDIPPHIMGDMPPVPPDDTLGVSDDPSLPNYPLFMKNGGKNLHSGSEWIASWERAIKNRQAAKALDRLRADYELNKPAIKAVREFDLQAADEVEQKINAALADEGAAHEPEDLLP